MGSLGSSASASISRAFVNASTRMHERSEQRVDARRLFIRAYSLFADQCRTVDESGLAVVVVEINSGSVVGVIRVGARVGRSVSAIIGRHEHCDLRLPHANDEVALRQVAIILDPLISWKRDSSEVRYRLFDLRSSTPMTDENGARLGGLLADGPSIVQFSCFVMYVLPLGDPSDWPSSGKDAWSFLPERCYLDAHEPRGLHQRSRWLTAKPATFITRLHGPYDSYCGLAHGDALGTLLIGVWPNPPVALPVSAHSLRHGVLIGRYDRCDQSRVVAIDPTLSRVHALLVANSSSVFLVDTASRYGLFNHNGVRERTFDLSDGNPVRLGCQTFARWLPNSRDLVTEEVSP